MSRTSVSKIAAFFAALCSVGFPSLAETSGSAVATAPAAPGMMSMSPPYPAGTLPTTLLGWTDGAQIFDGIGNFHRKVTTNSDAAQAYFDQGMRFLWAFNHDEATRSFAKAAQIDPQCAMCYWGVALTIGPNYNMPMMADPRGKVGWETLGLAQQHAGAATALEHALIAALASRYRGSQALDPSNQEPVLIAYAQAMKDVARTFPNDLDVQTLTAEAMMNVNAWKLWTADGAPVKGTEEIVEILEGVLAVDPSHPGANHYYVHTMEASRHPEKAVVAAESLRGMMPAAGHLDHMPAHIMQRVGRYEEASEANRKGAAADLAYYAKTRPPDYYAMYTAHNYQFLAFSAAMEGRRAEAIDAGRKSRATISDELLLAMPGADWYVAELYTAMVRFGLWDDILAEPPPDPNLPGLMGGHLYATAVALAAKGRIDEAKAKAAELDRFSNSVPADVGAGQNTLRDVLAVALLAARARIAGAEQKDGEALVLLRAMVAKEDQLAYDEPEDWFFPGRHLLGAALLTSGQAHEAETVYQDDLSRHPANGWALYGLAESLKALGRVDEAADLQQQFKKAWEHADVTLTASAY